MNASIRTVCLGFALVVLVAHAAVIKPPRDGLFGVSRQSNFALHAIDNVTGLGEQIGGIANLVPTAAVRQPSSGRLFVFGTELGAQPTIVMVELDATTGATTGSLEVQSAEVTAPDYIAYVSAADYDPDGALFVNVGVFDDSAQSVVDYLAKVEDLVVGDDFVDADLIGPFPTAMTGLSFDPDNGELWGVSPATASDPNKLFKFATVNPAAWTDYPLTDGAGGPPGLGFASLQFTCDRTLYAGSLESVVNRNQVDATYVGPGSQFSGFSFQYDDMDGDGLFSVDDDLLVSFSGLTRLTGQGRHWDSLIGAPDVAGVATASGYTEGGATDEWWVDDSTASDPVGREWDDWTYTVTFVQLVPQNDGGELFTVSTSAGSQGTITRVASPPASASGGAGLSGFAPATSCNVTSVQNAPIAQGNGIGMFSIEAFEQQASFNGVAGTGSLGLCVGRDARVTVRSNGQIRRTSRFLSISELSNTGTCGNLSHINLRVPPTYESYLGWLDRNENGSEDGGERDYWLVVAVAQTQGVTLDGPAVVATYPEALIEYTAIGVPNPRDLCRNDNVSLRPRDLGGTVPALGDFPNVEGNLMIDQTVQCNGPTSMTRRTTHVYPVSLVETRNEERIAFEKQLQGISGTVNEALSLCTVPPPELSSINGHAGAAQNYVAQNQFNAAILELEGVARDAQNANWSSCPAAANYKGSFMLRGLAAAFTVFDRMLDPADGQIYYIPDDLDVPLLKTRAAGTDPYPATQSP